MSASIKNKKNKKSRKKRIRYKPVVYFFDNDAENFRNCPNNVVMIKTPETDGKQFHYMSRESKLRNQDSVLSIYEPYLRPHVKWLIKIDKCTGGLFDIYSGIEKHPILYNNSIQFNKNDKFFIDFDRTISITEGFLGDGNKNTTLNDLVTLYREKGFLGDMDDLVTVQMGGYNRRKIIRNMLLSIIDIVKKKNVIIITNNILKKVISDFMFILLNKHIIVVSTKEINMKKCEYIKQHQN